MPVSVKKFFIEAEFFISENAFTFFNQPEFYITFLRVKPEDLVREYPKSESVYRQGLAAIALFRLETSTNWGTRFLQRLFRGANGFEKGSPLLLTVTWSYGDKLHIRRDLRLRLTFFGSKPKKLFKSWFGL